MKTGSYQLLSVTDEAEVDSRGVGAEAFPPAPRRHGRAGMKPGSYVPLSVADEVLDCDTEADA
eukprot:CAMPEP_0179334868 /NCGR_PEP_ID=MMETSP0797-20121207/66175_1 /TAXON_ID=47934 /ORGANISM="Dinophysis acuminata, Strain DAEP01" /LENGTH=62 /DNA_ID=CAMNT_0021048189 /DNA_START=1 /DNA_END=185 /DNA_ORIENTATION=-